MFEHVNFSYLDEQPVLEDFSAVLPLGCVLALQDSWSSGKRTILRLLTKDLHPLSGHILCPPNLRMVMVEASPVLLPDDSLFNNAMAFAADWVTERMCWDLVKAFGVRSLPELKARRALQKTGMIITVARALLTDPDVLILLRARWPGGQWQEHVLSILYRWQRLGLRALLGDDHREELEGDRTRSRTLILTKDEKELHGIKADRTFIIQTRSTEYAHLDDSRLAEGDIACGLQETLSVVRRMDKNAKIVRTNTSVQSFADSVQSSLDGIDEGAELDPLRELAQQPIGRHGHRLPVQKANGVNGKSTLTCTNEDGPELSNSSLPTLTKHYAESQDRPLNSALSQSESLTHVITVTSSKPSCDEFMTAPRTAPESDGLCCLVQCRKSSHAVSSLEPSQKPFESIGVDL